MRDRYGSDLLLAWLASRLLSPYAKAIPQDLQVEHSFIARIWSWVVGALLLAWLVGLGAAQNHLLLLTAVLIIMGCTRISNTVGDIYWVIYAANKHCGLSIGTFIVMISELFWTLLFKQKKRTNSYKNLASLDKT